MVSTAAFHARDRGSVPGLGGLKETKMFLPHPRVKVSIVGSLRDWEVACSASDRQGSNFKSCVWRIVSSQSSHQPQEVLLAQFSLYVHKGGLKPDSFHFICYKTHRIIVAFSDLRVAVIASGQKKSMHTLIFFPIVLSPRTIGDVSPNSSELCVTLGEHSARYSKVQDVPDTSAKHRRCSQHARVNIGYV